MVYRRERGCAHLFSPRPLNQDKTPSLWCGVAYTLMAYDLCLNKHVKCNPDRSHSWKSITTYNYYYYIETTEQVYIHNTPPHICLYRGVCSMWYGNKRTDY